MNQATTPQSVLYTAGESLEVLDYPSGAALMLNPMALQALDWSLEGSVDFVDERGYARRIESRAICSTDYHGNVVTGWKGVDVPSLIPDRGKSQGQVRA